MCLVVGVLYAVSNWTSPAELSGRLNVYSVICVSKLSCGGTVWTAGTVFAGYRLRKPFPSAPDGGVAAELTPVIHHGSGRSAGSNPTRSGATIWCGSTPVCCSVCRSERVYRPPLAWAGPASWPASSSRLVWWRSLSSSACPRPTVAPVALAVVVGDQRCDTRGRPDWQGQSSCCGGRMGQVRGGRGDGCSRFPGVVAATGRFSRVFGSWCPR